ncbi:DMP19 family protein [Bradyrhizobium lablabi]|uniref:DMP19 family protein n=1 Tax=Bradyrhizobium lablabi TaxID=722472 RepID=UPI0018F8C4EE|nr:DUF4375 domain-containing protein [Bradyrhizobium lablabi]
MSKIPCVRCNAPILQATADSTGGLCMPCKAGTREALEAGKRRIREEREQELTDPLRKLWRDLVRRVYDTKDGFAGLSEAEKQYFAVGLLDGDIYNGGFDQYFFNSSSTYYSHAVLGLESMGASQALALLQRAKHVLFAFNEVPEDTDRRRATLRKNTSESHALRLRQLDELYWKDPDGLQRRSEAFAQRHKLV